MRKIEHLIKLKDELKERYGIAGEVVIGFFDFPFYSEMLIIEGYRYNEADLVVYLEGGKLKIDVWKDNRVLETGEVEPESILEDARFVVGAYIRHCARKFVVHGIDVATGEPVNTYNAFSLMYAKQTVKELSEKGLEVRIYLDGFQIACYPPHYTED